MAVVEIVPDRAARENNSYEWRGGLREAARIRLTSREGAALSYIFSDWDSEIGLASNFGAMVQALASKAEPESPTAARRRAASREPQTAVPKAEAHGYDVEKMSLIETWCMKKIELRRDILENLAGRVRDGESQDPSLVVLYALYGDRPPGLPEKGLWAHSKDDTGPGSLDWEYRRVVRYVPESGGSGAALDARLRFDRKPRKDETAAAFTERLKAAEANRKGLLVELGRSCERLIVAAACAYRVARRAQP